MIQTEVIEEAINNSIHYLKGDSYTFMTTRAITQVSSDNMVFLNSVKGELGGVIQEIPAEEEKLFKYVLTVVRI
jgi:hypothetical protein